MSGAAGELGPQAVQVRSDFRVTALWEPAVMTGADGRATVELKMPDSLTTWRATARAVSEGNRFGMGSSSTRSKKPLIVRLQGPRFFVVGDTTTLSAVINNNSDRDLTVSPELQVSGLNLQSWSSGSRSGGGTVPAVSIAAGGEVRVDWTVSVEQAGSVQLRVSGVGGGLSDAMERRYLAHEHGLDKLVAAAGKATGSVASTTIALPAARVVDSTQLRLTVSPSLAVTMLDALPYLVHYPYGCTEQTMSRFLPAVITAGTLGSVGLDPAVAMSRVFGGIEQATAVQTHPKGTTDLGQLDEVIERGLARLYDFQHRDGGWGWWKEGDSDRFMSAYTVWGLGLAQQAGVTVRSGVISRGADYLDKQLVEAERAPDMQAWMLHALSAYRSMIGASPSELQRKAIDNLWGQRGRLNAYTRALFALALHHSGDADRAAVVVRNLENGAAIDRAVDRSVLQQGLSQPGSAPTGTAHWGNDGFYWRWSDGGVEATAFALRAFLAIDPDNELVDLSTNWLIKNRRGAQWSNTRDTAIVVLALNDYLRTSGELTTEATYDVLVNGAPVGSGTVTPETTLSAPNTFDVEVGLLRDGDNHIELRRTSGSGALYWSAEARFTSLEEPVTAAGNELFVRRDYFRLSTRPTLLSGVITQRQRVEDGDALNSGDRVEVVLNVETKNNYEYLLFEDLKPAGLEAVQIRSGERLWAERLDSDAVAAMVEDAGESPADEAARARRATRLASRGSTGGGGIERRWVYQELRDRNIAMFVDSLPQGVWQIRYELRAEVPGEFHALPVTAQAMYVPEIRANGRELRLRVLDR